MKVCMYVCIYVCMYVCTYIHGAKTFMLYVLATQVSYNHFYTWVVVCNQHLKQVKGHILYYIVSRASASLTSTHREVEVIGHIVTSKEEILEIKHHT